MKVAREPERISSASSRSVRLARDLRRPEGIREHSAFLVEGRRFASDVISRDPSIVIELIVSESAAREGVLEFSGRVVIVPDRLFSQISDTVTSQGIAAVCRLPAYETSSFDPGPGPCVVPILDGFSDPGNAGTLIRTAAAFGCPAVFLTAGSCEAFSPKVTRASAGANAFLPVFQRADPADLAALLRHFGFRLLAAEAGGSAISKEAHDRVALVIGSEAAGISLRMRALCDCSVTIPMPGGTDSLNAAVAGAILMFLLSQKN